MALVVKRNEGETWRDAAVRYGAAYDLEQEVAQSFDAARKDGATEEDAALDACVEWDVADLEDWTE